MNPFVKFILGLLSMVMAVIVTIALIGAIVCGNTFFMVCGIYSLIIWAVIVIRSLKAHKVTEPLEHPNHL